VRTCVRLRRRRRQPLVRGDRIDWTNISSTVKDQYNRGDYENAVQMIWIVLPNEDADKSRSARGISPGRAATSSAMKRAPASRAR